VFWTARSSCTLCCLARSCSLSYFLFVAVEVEADTAEALDKLVAATQKWLQSIGATIVESMRDDEDIVAAYVVRTKKDLSSTLLDANLPGNVEIEPLD